MDINSAVQNNGKMPEEYKYKSKSQSRTPSNDLDRNAFLNLLVTQMKYQDPMAPTDNQEYIAQMAQFSALEQMQQISQSSQMSQAYSMMGKTATGNFVNSVTKSSETVVGEVTSVKLKSGTVYVTISGKDVELSKVSEIKNTSNPNETEMIKQIGALNKTITELKADIAKIVENTKAKETKESDEADGLDEVDE